MCNAIVRTQRPNRRICQVGCPRIETICPPTREIERASEHDPELKSVRECLLNGKWHALEFKEYLPVRGELSAIGRLVLRGTRIVIPKQLRCQVLELAHEGHPGIVAMKQGLCTKCGGQASTKRWRELVRPVMVLS